MPLLKFKPRLVTSSVDEAEKLAWLRLARTENVGPVTFYRLVETCGGAAQALDRLPELSRRGGRAKPLIPPAVTAVEKEYAALRKIGGDIIIAREPDYPLALAATDDAPPVISVLGRRELLNQPTVAIVGARNASLNGRKFAEILARDLGRQKQVIASGLARGIDTAAHQGSLESGTIAVVAGGIDVVYPEENQKLYEEISEQGLIIAESPLGQKPFAQSFPKRNRIVSGLSQGVVIVEATLRSGSLITARLAGEQGRDVFAVPGHPLDPRAEGTNHLIREGVTLVRNATDVLESLMNFSGQPRLSEPPARAPVFDLPEAEIEEPPEDARTRLIASLSHEAVNVDELVRTCAIGVAATQILLLELELAGRLKRLPGNRVSLIT
ncbi:MAG: DNA-processing protein DprA [Alphaproteobacteria bacterium]|nr:DNA-processing protein DprA [Alphaproteobacteria bacterium]